MDKKRDVTFDVMKGVAILAMIAGHCFVPLKLHHFIYIWHMPLFFFASGYFFKDKPLATVASGIWKGLLVPYLVTAAVVLACMVFSDYAFGTELLRKSGVGLLAVNGLFANPEVYGGPYRCGPIWFLLGLGWCKMCYSLLRKLRLNVVVETLLIAGLSYLISCWQSKLYLPFFILQGLVSLIFYHAGYLFKKYLSFVIKHKIAFVMFSVLALCVGCFQSGMDIWGLWFSCWPLNVYAAIGSVVLLYFITKRVQITPPILSHGISYRIFKYLAHVGRLSVLVLALHAIEKILSLCSTFFEMQHIIPVGTLKCRFVTILSQFLFCLLGLFVVERIKWVRKLFYIR